MPDKSRLTRPLRVFLCHSSNDKPVVRELYQQLRAEDIAEDFDVWFDEEKLLPGQDWRQEIEKAVRTSDVVIICLSKGSINKRGFTQKEIKDALDVADEQPEGAIFLIPLRLEECQVPELLRRWQWVDLFEEKGFERLIKALWARAQSLGLAKVSPEAIKILFLAANPSDTTTRLRLDEEIRAIDEALRQVECRDKFDIRQLPAVQVSDLQSHLVRYKPAIVHFSGRGSKASEIILEGARGESHPVSVRALSSLFSGLKDNVWCVVLNACYSEGQAWAIAQHIDYVIGMPKTISDNATISFMKAFYQALGAGEDVMKAHHQGCVRIVANGLDDRDLPELLTIIRLLPPIKYQGEVLLVRQTETEIVVENIHDSPVAIRISWDGDDPHGIGAGTDSFIDSYAIHKGRESREFKNHTSVQVWAWGTSGALIDSCSFLID